MPCNSEYMEPSYTEIKSKKLCEDIVFICKKLKIEVPLWSIHGSNSYYGSNELEVEEIEKFIYNIFKKMSNEQINSIIYDAKNKKSRKLADTYEEYLEFKQKQKNKEDIKKEKIDKRKKFDKILAKLRKEEVDIIMNYINHNEL